MPLIDLKTDLKSLKYGKDQLGGGNSGQPYIQTDINKIDTGFNRLRFTKFDDGLIRGGAIGALNASVVDTIRIGKFLKDFPKGPLFITKQIGLQLSNPRLEFKKLKTDNPTTGGGLLRNVGNIILNAANTIVNAVGPTRIYNLGINTLAQIPVNAFGGHFNRHGLLPVQNEDTKYINVVANNNEGNNNRLVGLKNKFELGDNNTETSNQFNLRNARRDNREANSTGRRNNRLVNRSLRQGAKTEGFEFNRIKYKRQKLDTTTLTIDSYIGGPKSVYGIGRTIINRYDFTEDKDRIDKSIENGKAYRLVGHEGGTKDGYTDASRRITNFTGVSDEIGSIFAPNPTFFNDGKSIQSVFAGRRDYTPLGLDDKIASKDDPKDSKYTAANQEASASNNIKSFISLSNYSGSIYSTTTFPNLKDNTPPTLKGFTASLSDPADNLLNNPWVNQVTASNDLGVSNQYFLGSTIDLQNSDTATYGSIVTEPLLLVTDNNNNIDPASTKIGAKARTLRTDASYQKYQQIIESKQLRERTFVLNTATGQEVVNRFGIYGNSIPVKETLGNISPDSTNIPIYSNDTKVLEINIPWNRINRENRIGSGEQDSINLTPIFNANTGTIKDFVKIGGKTFIINDLAKFRIQAIDGDNPLQSNWMIFRAYITQFSDSSDSSWNEIKYAGRGDRFYVYDGFSRKIQIGFKVAALSAEEMKPMYQKLNYLMGNTMPDYKGALMRGPLVRMTVGNWIDGQPGILNNVSYTVPQDSPWEIGLRVNGNVESLVLPHVVEVNMTFTPIGSQTQDENKISRRSLNTSHIAQNYNGKNEGSNYIE